MLSRRTRLAMWYLAACGAVAAAASRSSRAQQLRLVLLMTLGGLLGSTPTDAIRLRRSTSIGLITTGTLMVQAMDVAHRRTSPLRAAIATVTTITLSCSLISIEKSPWWAVLPGWAKWGREPNKSLTLRRQIQRVATR